MSASSYHHKDMPFAVLHADLERESAASIYKSHCPGSPGYEEWVGF